MKKKILIVEDEQEMRMMLALELETLGYEVIQAADGEEGFAMARDRRPDLIVSDVMMPRMDGNQLLKKLKESDFGREIPFVVLTARGKMRDYFEVVDVDAFIEKPFEAEEFVRTVEKVLGPAVDEPRSPRPASPESSPAAEGRTKSDVKKKILLVEDEEDMRAMIALELESSGYEVTQAADGEEGFVLAQKIRPDLIIADIMMPKMDGNQLLKKLKDSDFGREIPFVVLTARGKMRDYFELVDVDAFVEKPFEPEEFLRTIGKILKQSPSTAKPVQGAKEDRPFSVPSKKEVSPAAENIPEEMEVILYEDMVRYARPEMDFDQALGGSPRNQPSGWWQKFSGKATPSNKVLILENDLAIYKSLEVAFLHRKYRVEVIRTPAKCLEAAIRFDPDIIFSKVNLPEMTVAQLVTALSGIDDRENIPVILYSTEILNPIPDDILRSGANCLIIDMTEDKLVHVADMILRNKRNR